QACNYQDAPADGTVTGFACRFAPRLPSFVAKVILHFRGEEFEVRSGHGLFLETDAPHACFCAGRQPARLRMIVIEAPETRI
ncbi:MAG: hypothetical protein P4K98_01880, partial [Bryobacteraceae bacterium]|nr:hypothetical protein [Bryobacteraceae bacterium]